MMLSWRQIARLGCVLTHKKLSTLNLQNVRNSDMDLTRLQLPQLVNVLQKMSRHDTHRLLFDSTRRMSILEHVDDQIQNGAAEAQHQALAEIYKSHFTQMSTERGASFVLSDISFMLEERLFDEIDKLIEPRFSKLSTQIPLDSSRSFIRWLLKIIQTHPSSSHPFYKHFMRQEATREDLRFWLAQESTLDQRFDDVLATLQVGTNGFVKMEIAKNYWDEMGNGDHSQTHTLLFAQLLDELEVTPSYIASNLLPVSLLTGNLSSCLAMHRHLFYEALGYFGVVEYLAPSRFKNVLIALKRNGVSEQGQAYHKLHIWIDHIHGASWFNDVVRSVIEKNPESAKAILRGVLARLETSLLHLNSLQITKSSSVKKENE